ncbi:hypothetical protein [Pedobacter nutrimenti]|uniref:Lipocalin-like protein n=1 Tax=Pedobacter nutrimenti TaxID=1241337 RepID=A0A318UBP4_9SPHI|nr:hypothetical protein [Pedobacter nutrimenti]PYF72973.1 hypothetical protein B0O44_105348 [Pedobacter nutrimenti]
MKFLSILILSILVSLSAPQEAVLQGRYKMIFEKEFSSQNGTISFDKTTYRRVRVNSESISGKIDYQKFRVVLKDDNHTFQIILSKRTIGKDTIPFSTIDLSKKVEADILINEGMLIKLN